jgi:hypothetical protein
MSVRNNTKPAKNNNQAPKPKKIENLARTGIEYPFSKERKYFISKHKEYEPIGGPISCLKLEEYQRKDSENY